MLPKLLFARILAAILLVLWLARIASARTLVVRRTPLDVPWLLFVGSAALSWAVAENRNVAWLGIYGRYDGLLTILTYAALFWLSVQSLADQGDARVLILVGLASGYAVAAVAIIQSLHDSLLQRSFAQAFGSMGNANVLGAFLALVIALAAGELVRDHSAAARILLLNVLVVAGLALVLSFSRSSWFATIAAIIFLVAARRRRARVFAVFVPAAALLIAVVAAGYSIAGHGQLEAALAERGRSVLDPGTLLSTRTGIWGDTLRVIASRPLTGYGPDNLGLVFPRFQRGDWGLTAQHVRQPIDKAHAELLQVAATQGLVGVTTYLLVQLAFLRALWRARRSDQAIAAGAGWIAYQLVVQLNFTALAAALPFWIFAAAAAESCDAVRVHTVTQDLRRGYLILVPGAALAAAVTWSGVVLPNFADVRLREAVDADYSRQPQRAQPLAAEARRLAPWESVYAVEVGNIAFEQDQWKAARDAYRQAADLGTFNDLVYRNLALADRNLGLLEEGKTAALKAVELDRFDPANQALLAEFEARKT